MRCLLYKDYESGFANDVLSIELGVGLAALTGRTLVVYGSADQAGRLQPLRGGHSWHVPPRRRHLIDTARRPTILDLLDPLPVPTLDHASFLAQQREQPSTRHDSELHLPGAALIAAAGVSPARAAAFADGRTVFVDRPEDVWHLSRCNLGYYSRTLYPIDQHLLNTLAGVRVREPYRALAAQIAAALGRFNGVHVRLTDFRQFLPHVGPDYATAVLQTLRELFDARELLLISTDEPDNADFFAPILAAFPRTVFVDQFIVDRFATPFRRLEFTDETAFSVICNLVMRHAERFVGTPGSTFSGLIHRAWGQRMHARGMPFAALDFRYVTSGSPAGAVAFERGMYLTRQRGPFSWNRIALPRPTDMQSWYREWPEACVPASALPEMLGPTAASAHLPVPRMTARPMDLSWLATPHVAPPTERPDDASLSDTEIEAMLLAEAAPALREAGSPIAPIGLSDATTGRSLWVRWGLAAMLALQLLSMWWPRG